MAKNFNYKDKLTSDVRSNLVERTDKTKKKFMRLDIDDFSEYLELMANYKGVSMTKYIQELLKNDMDSNAEIFQKLQEIERMKNSI